MWAATKAFKAPCGNRSGEAAQIQEGPVLTWALKDERAFVGREGRALEVWQVHRGSMSTGNSVRREGHRTRIPFPSVPTGLLVLREAGPAPEVMTFESERMSTFGCALQADFKMQNSPWV